MEFRPPYRPAATPLDEEAFWSFWEAARAESGGDLFRMQQAFSARVTEPDDDAVQALQARLVEVTGRLHTWRHRAAVELLIEDCDEHDHAFFGPFLLAHGREAVERFAADADALADLELSGPPTEEYDRWTFGEELRHYARMLGDSFGGMVMHRRPGWADENFDRSNPAWAPLAPPPGAPYADVAAARADLPRMAALGGSTAHLLPWTLVNIGPVVESAGAAAELLVEIWVPTAGLSGDEVEPLLHALERFLECREHGLSAESFDDDEEIDEHFVFSVWRAPERELLEVARLAASLPQVPAGTFALVTTVGQQLSGDGRRVELGQGVDGA